MEMDWSLQFVAVSYTHLDVYKRQVSVTIAYTADDNRRSMATRERRPYHYRASSLQPTVACLRPYLYK